MSDYMKEAERLVSELIDATHGTVLNEDQSREDEVRAALLAHIQRGAVSEHSKQDVRCGCCGYMTYHREHMGCIRAAAPAPDHFRDAAKMVAAPAGVPMPKPVAYGFGNTAITGHTNRLMMVRIDVPLDDQYAGAFWLPLVLADEARTYGVACRAAGEAAGYARGLREMRDCRTCRNYTRDGCIQTAQCVDGDGYRRATPVRFWSAALRGEVKP